jgi:hypothetical protein
VSVDVLIEGFDLIGTQCSMDLERIGIGTRTVDSFNSFIDADGRDFSFLALADDFRLRLRF